MRIIIPIPLPGLSAHAHAEGSPFRSVYVPCAEPRDEGRHFTRATWRVRCVPTLIVTSLHAQSISIAIHWNKLMLHDF